MSTQAAATSVQTSIVVEVPLERAFAVFTEDFDKIKPRDHNPLTSRSRSRSSSRAKAGRSTTAAATAADAAGRECSPMSHRTGSSSAGTSTRDGRSRPITTRRVCLARELLDKSKSYQTFQMSRAPQRHDGTEQPARRLHLGVRLRASFAPTPPPDVPWSQGR